MSWLHTVVTWSSCRLAPFVVPPLPDVPPREGRPSHHAEARGGPRHTANCKRRLEPRRQHGAEVDTSLAHGLTSTRSSLYTLV